VSHAVAEAVEAGVRTAVEVPPQKPAQVLVDGAHRHDGRVVVVGTRGGSPLRGAVLGSVSHELLHLSDLPALCVPAGRTAPGVCSFVDRWQVPPRRPGASPMTTGAELRERPPGPVAS
jgi:hypothetical protein